jgi:hypothetical protein
MQLGEALIVIWMRRAVGGCVTVMLLVLQQLVLL